MFSHLQLALYTRKTFKTRVPIRCSIIFFALFFFIDVVINQKIDSLKKQQQQQTVITLLYFSEFFFQLKLLHKHQDEIIYVY
jgi:hypothetical protein